MQTGAAGRHRSGPAPRRRVRSRAGDAVGATRVAVDNQPRALHATAPCRAPTVSCRRRSCLSSRTQKLLAQRWLDIVGRGLCCGSRSPRVAALHLACRLIDDTAMKILWTLLATITLASNAHAQNPPDWPEPFPAFRIADNLYYVGSKGLASYLITTPQGHILINSDLEATCR